MNHINNVYQYKTLDNECAYDTREIYVTGILMNNMIYIISNIQIMVSLSPRTNIMLLSMWIISNCNKIFLVNSVCREFGNYFIIPSLL